MNERRIEEIGNHRGSKRSSLGSNPVIPVDRKPKINFPGPVPERKRDSESKEGTYYSIAVERNPDILHQVSTFFTGHDSPASLWGRGF